MTAKHRKGKGNNKNEENFFKNEVADSDARVGGNNYNLPLVSCLIIVIGGAIGAWFCFQQHQTLTHLTNELMGLQMKIVKLQSSHEELRQSSGKQYISENLENRLNAMEESNTLVQKQMEKALATAEQLKMSDLPAQVLSLHAEMKARLTEVQQSTASLEQLGQLHTILEGRSEEFKGVRNQVDGLLTLSAEISQKVESLTGSLGEAESKLNGQVATLSTTLDKQAAEVLRLKKQMNIYQAQVEDSTQEVATLRELIESEESPLLNKNVEEQLNALHQSLQDQSSAAFELQAQLENLQKQVTQLMEGHPGETIDQTGEETTPAAPEAPAAVTEEEALAADVEKESFSPVKVKEAAPIGQQDTATEVLTPTEKVEAAKEDQVEKDESIGSSESKEVAMTQTDEKVPEEEKQKADEDEEFAKDSHFDEKSQKADEEEFEREESHKENQPEEEVASEEEQELEEELLENKKVNVEQEVAEEQEGQQHVEAEGEGRSEKDSSAQDK